MCSTVGEVRQALAALAQTLDPNVLSQDQAVSLVREAAGIERLAAVIKSLAGLRVAEGAAWRSDGSRTAAEWFARTTGTSPGRARDTLDTPPDAS